MSEIQNLQAQYQQTLTNLLDIFNFDPQLLFSDTFDRINQQLSIVSSLLEEINQDQPNYFVVYNIVISIIPFIERIIFAGYSDQILEFSLKLHQSIASNLMFCTSRFVPFRLQIFLLVCAIYANLEESHDKDADLFIQTFKTEMMTMKELEETNINGLTETIETCDHKKVVLEELYGGVFTSIELIHAHFSTSEEVTIDKIGSSRKQAKKPSKSRPIKDEPANHPISVPSVHTVNMIINMFNSPLSKQEYISKYGSAIQSWTVPECDISPILLHRLIYCFIRSGNLDNLEALTAALPEDKIVPIALNLSAEKWLEASELISGLTKEEISVDFQFYNEYALKIWNRFTSGKIEDPRVLKGVLHILFNSPSPCPVECSLAALHYSWYLDSLNLYEEAYKVAENALSVLEKYRDYFSIRKTQKVISASPAFPNKPLDHNYLQFEKWLECLHVDLYTIFFRSRLKYGLEKDIEKAKIEFAEFLEKTKEEKINETRMYGSLDAAQRKKYDTLLNKPFIEPKRSTSTEKMLLEQYKDNYGAKAILYIQMSFFTIKQASKLLQKARESLKQFESIQLPINSPLIFNNRTQISLLCQNQIPEAKTMVLFGKENVNGSIGLTTSNTALKGTGEKHDKTEPFLVTNLKPNTLYTFAFGGFDSHDEIVDGLLPAFSISTCHSLSMELIWSYLSSAAYSLKDNESFDLSLSLLMNNFTYVEQIADDHKFFQNLNPYHRFKLKAATVDFPAPILRQFSSCLIMASRLFDSKPYHAASFLKIALSLSQILDNQELTLTICHEMLATIEQNLVNKFHSKWVINPLLSIVSALNKNKKSVKSELHQSILAQASFAIDTLFIRMYKERQLSQFIINAVQTLPQDEFRTFFLLFASKNQLLDSSTGESTLLSAAADSFRSSPERSFDDIFNRYKADPLLGDALVYLISAAHNIGLYQQALNWSTTALEFLKNQLHEAEDKQSTKAKNAKNVKQAKPTKKPAVGKGKDKPQGDSSKPPEEVEAETNAALKIQSAYNKYRNRRKNIAKFFEANKSRAALSYLAALCLLELDGSAMFQQDKTERIQSTSRSKATKGATSKQSKTASKKPEEEETVNPDQITVIFNTFRHAIVFADRCGKTQIIVDSSRMIYTVLSGISPSNPSFQSISTLVTTFSTLVIENMPETTDPWPIRTLQSCLLILLADNKTNIVLHLLEKASENPIGIGGLQWMLDSNSISEKLKKAIESLNRIDQSESVYYSADMLLQRAQQNLVQVFPDEPVNTNDAALIEAINTTAINLQHKQRLSMSISLFTKLAFTLFQRNRTDQAISTLFEALECHFRVVKAYEKVNQILENETEESFYTKHSWAGCISIAVIASFISMYTKRTISMNLARLAAFALSSIFTASPNNPKKSIDFIEFEPCEIINGIDIFTAYDPNQPLLEPIQVEYITVALNHLISSLYSYELYFEMFKPLSFARHFFRFISRHKAYLGRARLMTFVACCEFGLMKSGMNVLNDFISHFGEPRVTSELTLYPANAKRVQFSVTEPPYSQTNQECIKSLTSLINQIATDYGPILSYQYGICISKFCMVAAECSDPLGSTSSSTSDSNKDTTASATANKHKKQHPHSKGKGNSAASSSLGNPDNDSSKAGSGQSSGFYTSVLRTAETLINDCITKEKKNGITVISLELLIVKAQIYLKQWRWDNAIQIANEVLQNISTLGSRLSLEQPLLLVNGIISAAKSIIFFSAYNINDFKLSNQYASHYYKSLMMIRNADYEGATHLLSQVSQLKPITAFHYEYILSIAQYITLLCYEPHLITSSVAFSKKLQSPIKAVQNQIQTMNQNEIKEYVLQLIENLNSTTTQFFIEQLALNEERSYFLRFTFLMIRLSYLESVANTVFNGDKNPLTLLNSANEQMMKSCPYINHGLSFLLNSAVLKIQTDSIVKQCPYSIFSWNIDTSPLQRTYSQELVDKTSESTLSLFMESPDCIIHPSSRECALNNVLLAGLATTNRASSAALPTNVSVQSFSSGLSRNDSTLQIVEDKKYETSKIALVIASNVHTTKRVLLQLISRSSENTPMNLPALIMNDNKDLNFRGLAHAYYTHACSLELPLFDTSLLEERTFFFFKCFEDKLPTFKISNKESILSSIEPGTVLGQWYPIDSALFKSSESANDAQLAMPRAFRGSPSRQSTIKSSMASSRTLTSTTTASTTTSSSSLARRRNAAGVISTKGQIMFFLGLTLDLNNATQKKPTDKTSTVSFELAPSNYETPIIIAAQGADLSVACAEMSEVGLDLEEALQLEASDLEGDTSGGNQVLQSGNDANVQTGRDAKKKKPPVNKLKTPDAPHQMPSLLKNQADIQKRSAELQWELSLHKVINILSKSNRIIAKLIEAKGRWLGDVTTANISMQSAYSISHFLSTNYGINEKCQPLVEWLNSFANQALITGDRL